MSRKLIAIVILLLFVGCTNPAADKPRAVTSEAAPAATTNASGQRYVITPDNSRIEFVGSKVTGSHNGAIEKFDGAIDYAGQPEKSRVRITMSLGSITTDDPKLTAHLKTADFFDVARFPEASFESTEIKAGGEKGATHTVTGNLQLRGVTKSISFPASINATADAVTVDSTFSINRKEFGINYAGAADNLIHDDVVLRLKVRGTKG
jgi:polyisoprenoid-binding protein YceI